MNFAAIVMYYLYSRHKDCDHWLITAAVDVVRERVKYGRKVSQLKWRRSRLNRITGRGELKHDEIR